MIHDELHEDFIISKSVPVNNGASIYFLINEGKIVYVGQSKNIFARIGDHIKSKSFDSYFVFSCQEENIDVMESFYIHKFNPELNAQIFGGGEVAPVAANQLEKIDIDNIDELLQQGHIFIDNNGFYCSKHKNIESLRKHIRNAS